MEFTFDNDRPIYIQLVEQLKVYIVSGKIKIGERLPSVRELAIQTQVNPNTMQKALQELENQKLIFTERTNGKYVTNDKELIDKIKKELAKEKINDFTNSMIELGIKKEEITKYFQELGGKN